MPYAEVVLDCNIVLAPMSLSRYFSNSKLDTFTGSCQQVSVFSHIYPQTVSCTHPTNRSRNVRIRYFIFSPKSVGQIQFSVILVHNNA